MSNQLAAIRNPETRSNAGFLFDPALDPGDHNVEAVIKDLNHVRALVNCTETMVSIALWGAFLNQSDTRIANDHFVSPRPAVIAESQITLFALATQIRVVTNTPTKTFLEFRHDKQPEQGFYIGNKHLRHISTNSGATTYLTSAPRHIIYAKSFPLL